MLLLVVSCDMGGVKQISKPQDLIPKSDMVQILTELSVLESVYRQKYIQVKRYSSILQQKSDSIFEIYHTDSIAFRQSMEYYGFYQIELKDIYQQVAANIKQKQKALNNNN